MKKFIALMLAGLMVLALASCGPEQKPDEGKKQPDSQGQEQKQGEDKDKEPEPPKRDATGIPAAVKLSDSTALEGKKIGCSICYKGDEWCHELAVALEKLGKYYGAEIVVEDGDLVDETQTKQIENMVANKCDMMWIDPITPDGSTEALNSAVAAKIPVIIYDGYWTDGEEKAVTTVTWDQKSTGTMIGKYFVDYIKKNSEGKAKVIELTNAVSTHCQERFVGLHEVFDEANANGCQIEVLNKYDSQGNRELAYNAIAAVVEPYDYIISDVDNGAMGAVSALQANGNDKVKVFCMGAYGAEPFGLLHDNDVNYTACLNVDAWVLAQFIVQGALDYFDGKDVPKLTNIDLYVVDKDNVGDFWSFD